MYGVNPRLEHATGATGNNCSGSSIIYGPKGCSGCCSGYAGAGREAIQYIQNLLVTLGYLDVASVTGQYGTKTYAAVQAFQKAYGLDTDGRVGSSTLPLLKEQADARRTATTLHAENWNRTCTQDSDHSNRTLQERLDKGAVVLARSRAGFIPCDWRVVLVEDAKMSCCRNNRGYAGGRDWTQQEITDHLNQGLLTQERANILYASPLAVDRAPQTPDTKPYWKAAALVAGVAGLAAFMSKKD